LIFAVVPFGASLYNVPTGERRSMEIFRRSIAELAAPICESCNIEMAWSRSALVASEQAILHVFICPRGGGIAEIKTPMKAYGQALDHENRKTPISKPAANAQRPNVQAEITRTRLRRSCEISWDRSVIATAPPFAAIAWAALYGRAASRRPGHAFSLNPNSGPVCPACNIGVALFAGLF
jgi:hypothetical protein